MDIVVHFFGNSQFLLNGNNSLVDIVNKTRVEFDVVENYFGSMHENGLVRTKER